MNKIPIRKVTEKEAKQVMIDYISKADGYGDILSMQVALHKFLVNRVTPRKVIDAEVVDGVVSICSDKSKG